MPNVWQKKKGPKSQDRWERAETDPSHLSEQTKNTTGLGARAGGRGLRKEGEECRKNVLEGSGRCVRFGEGGAVRMLQVDSSNQQQLARNTPTFLEPLWGQNQGRVALNSLRMKAELGHRGCRLHLGFLPSEFSQSSARSSGDLLCSGDNSTENVRAGPAGQMSGFGRKTLTPSLPSE